MPFLYSLALLVSVYLAEHLALTRLYRRPSSLQRLIAGRSESARADLPFVALYEIGLRWLGHLPKLLCGPGLLYLAVGWLLAGTGFEGVAGAALPGQPIVQAAILLVLLDLPLYATHVALHRIPLLWRFHAVHHAAREMTIANGSRVALAEYFLGELAILMFMTLLFGAVRPEIVLPVLIARNVIDMIQHSDLPWDFGPIGRVVASPRFHRMHHSDAAADLDANYGNILSLWDHLFGTVAPRYRADPTVADRCRIGLEDGELEARHNDWRRALVFATLPGDLLSWLQGAIQARRSRLQ